MDSNVQGASDDEFWQFIAEAEAKYKLGSAAAANYLGVSVATLDGLSATNEMLRPVAVGDRLAWRLCDLQRYLESQGKPLPDWYELAATMTPQ